MSLLVKLIAFKTFHCTTVAPRYNEPRYNEDMPRYNEQHLKARQNYSKISGNEPRYNEIPL